MKEPCYCGDLNCPWCGSAQQPVKPKRKRFRRINKMRTQKKKMLKAGKKEK